ncbi:membrane protein [alpha proteobacterium BAL199]|jgi:drug/metabolite transporter (DMT)-like permease|nr:membrane protein [alpha proteobacterium BAL199]
MALWVWLSIMAAAAQTARTAGQKHLSGSMSSWSATWVRFVFGLPFVIGYLLVATSGRADALPVLHPTFFMWCVGTAAAQIIATVLLVHLFSLRNFAVGTSYARTEAFLTALVGASLFGEAIDTAGWIAIVISVVGVVLISLAKQGVSGMALIRSGLNKAAGIGVLSGLFFALASLFLRRASLSLGDPDFLTTASMTLVTVVSIQTVLLGGYILATRANELPTIGRAWKACLFVGLTSAIGSGGWFTAMTIERAAYVKAMGQIEFVFAIAVSTLIFRERSTARELVGMSLVAVGIIVLLLYAR